MSLALPYVNIAAYKFITLDDITKMQPLFVEKCGQLQLKGTILLSPEGINLFLAGLASDIAGFIAWLRADNRFEDIEIKESFSETQPFKRMLVKHKPEIITMKRPLIKPELGRAPALRPADLKRWLDRGTDDAGRPVVMLDTRNAFEVDVGTFHDTIDYRIEKFSDFPDTIAAHKDEFAGKTVVTFCTGGIRCEKAAILMQDIGFDHVYQLDGGILKYFEEVGGAHYEGDCFVFDERTALNPRLESTPATTCPACQAHVSAREQLSSLYVPGKSCPHCAATASH